MAWSGEAPELPDPGRFRGALRTLIAAGARPR
jgi:hypothetical protein